MARDWPSNLGDSEQIFRKKERNENAVQRMEMIRKENRSQRGFTWLRKGV